MSSDEEGSEKSDDELDALEQEGHEITEVMRKAVVVLIFPKPLRYFQ